MLGYINDIGIIVQAHCEKELRIISKVVCVAYGVLLRAFLILEIPIQWELITSNAQIFISRFVSHYHCPPSPPPKKSSFLVGKSKMSIDGPGGFGMQLCHSLIDKQKRKQTFPEDV